MAMFVTADSEQTGAKNIVERIGDAKETEKGTDLTLRSITRDGSMPKSRSRSSTYKKTLILKWQESVQFERRRKMNNQKSSEAESG